MKPNVLERLRQNELVADSDKQKFYRFYDIANQVEFGKIAPRQEGYIFKDIKGARCTSVLQMDGSKAAALMEWAKRQVASRIEREIDKKMLMGQLLTCADVTEACMLGLQDPEQQRDEAAGVGTAEHDNIENWLTGGEYVETEGLKAFKKAWERSGLVCIATEIPLVYREVSSGRAFGGRCDILAYSPKQHRFVLGDNKTSRSVHESYACQLAGYSRAIAYMSNNDIQPNYGFIFHVPRIDSLNERQKKEYDKRGSLIKIEESRMDEAFEHFRLLLGLYYMRNNKYF